MLFQLGDREYTFFNAPLNWSYSGDEANLAEFPLINSKPRLQHTGVTLEELNLTFKFHAKHCNPSEEIAILKNWKDEGEVLPLLLGNGEYKNDYVIKSFSNNVLQTFSDGTIVECEVNLTLLEHYVDDKDQQRAISDRRSASAVGDREQIVRIPPQAASPEAQAHTALIESMIATKEIADTTKREWESGNISQFAFERKKIFDGVQQKISNARDKINNVQQSVTTAQAIINSINTVENRFNDLRTAISSPLNYNNIEWSVINLQAAVTAAESASSIFTKDIAIRRF